MSQLLTVVAISLSAVLVRLADAPPATTAFFRALYAWPVVLLWKHAGRRRDPRTMKERGLGFLAGLLFSAELCAWVRSIACVGASLATTLAATQVIFVAVIGWIVAGQLPRRLTLYLVPVFLMGVALISGVGQTDAYGADLTAGLLWGLLTGLMYAATILVLRRANARKLSPALPLLDLLTGLLLGSALLAQLEGGLQWNLALEQHLWLVAMALVVQSLGWLLLARLLPRLEPLQASVLLLLQPMMAVLWVQLVFAEPLSGGQWLGVAVLLGAVGVDRVGPALVRRLRRPAQRVAPAAATLMASRPGRAAQPQCE